MGDLAMLTGWSSTSPGDSENGTQDRQQGGMAAQVAKTKRRVVGRQTRLTDQRIYCLVYLNEAELSAQRYFCSCNRKWSE